MLASRPLVEIVPVGRSLRARVIFRDYRIAECPSLRSAFQVAGALLLQESVASGTANAHSLALSRIADLRSEIEKIEAGIASRASCGVVYFETEY